MAAPALFSVLPQAIRPSFPEKLLTKAAYTWSPENRLRTTSYMDGVRGLAAFLVVIHHWTDMDFVHPSSGHGYWNYEDPTRKAHMYTRSPVKHDA